MDMILRDKQILPSNHDGLPLEVMTIAPDNPKAVIVMHHGMTEHKERYIPLMERLAAEGYACILADMRGHGASVRHPEQRGFFYRSRGKGLLIDYHQLVYFARERYPELPVFLFGHSMGSLVVRCYIKAHDYQLAGVVLSGAPCKNALALPAKGIIKGLKLLKGDAYKSRFMSKLSMGPYDRKFRKEAKRFGWLSVSEQNRADYMADPQCGFAFTLDGYSCLMDLMTDAFDKKGWDVTDPQLPICLMGGENDPVAGSVKGFRDTVHFIRGRGYTHVKGKLYPGYRHEIFMDDCKDEAIPDLISWLNKAVWRDGRE